MRLAGVRCALFLLGLIRVNRIWSIVCRSRVRVCVCSRVNSGTRRTICVCADIRGVRRDYSWSMETARLLGRGNSGMSAIGRRKERAVLARFLDVLGLCGRHRCVLLSLSREFLRVRSSRCTAGAAVEAGAIHGRVVVDDRGVVSVVNDRSVDVGDRAIIVVDAAVPVSARESYAGVAKSIVNSAIESHVCSPVAGMPQISSSAPAPIAGRPEQTDRWRHHPCAGHPVISCRPVSPIAGRPDIPRRRTGRLHVNRKGRGSDMNGNADRDLGLRSGWQQERRDQHEKNRGKLDGSRHSFIPLDYFSSENPIKLCWSSSILSLLGRMNPAERQRLRESVQSNS